MTQKRYLRANMRKHFASDTFVSIDGGHIERDYTNPTTHQTKVQVLDIWIERASDRCFVKVSGKGHFYIDEMVLSCYRGTMKDGKKYLVHHKDGDMRNDNLSNLEWREATPENLKQQQQIIAASIVASTQKAKAAAKQKKMDWYKKNKVKVNKKGEIIQDGKALFQCDYISDRDLDWIYHRSTPFVRIEYKNPWGRYESKRFDVEEILHDFGIISGNPDNFKNPVVLYKNHDYLDSTPDNLEWCDASDQRYIDFKKEAHKRVMEKDHQCNHWLSETSWEFIYGSNEPYQDWSDRPKT